MKLNGHTVLASAVAMCGGMLSTGYASGELTVQLTCIVCATIIFVAACAHDAIKASSKEKTIRGVAADLTNAGKE